MEFKYFLKLWIVGGNSLNSFLIDFWNYFCWHLSFSFSLSIYLSISFSLYIYIYIYIYVCVCVCVCVLDGGQLAVVSI